MTTESNRSREVPKKLPRVDLPADARLDTLAVREGLPATPWGENSEALFLTSSFVHPDAATAAARFANEEEAFVYSRFTNPTINGFEASCFDGRYVTGDVSVADFQAMREQRANQPEDEDADARGRLALQGAGAP